MLNGFSKRIFIAVTAMTVAVALLFAASCANAPAATNKRVIVIGMDGFDPKIAQKMMADGRLPNFKKLAELGGFMTLRTSMPPQSPVAWSNFITGMNPGGHGISNFVQRDPKTYKPYYSIAETIEAKDYIQIFDLRIPLSGGNMVALRKGEPFWKYLTDEGITSRVIKVPVNFPPDDKTTVALSGMGTPDVSGHLGGLFSYFTTNYFESYPDLTGGRVFYVDLAEGVVEAMLIGPKNDLFVEKDIAEDEYINHSRVPFTVYLDSEPAKNRIARIEIQGNVFILKEGEFSDWVTVNFEMLPMVSSVSGICRFYLKEVSPHVRLYVTPINIDPRSPAIPISHPAGFSAELAEEIGPYFTQELPLQPKALDNHVFTDAEFVQQARMILDERLRMFQNEWTKFNDGFFFFYFTNTDLALHMLWRNIDPTHPSHADADPEQAEYVYQLYETMDRLVGRILPGLDENTLLLVMSDHGFASFAREVHLNTWLKRKGYLVIKPGAAGQSRTSLRDIDWSRTRAYGMGINGLYLNLKGREGQGIVDPADADALMEEIIRELEAEVDPENGRRIVSKLFRSDEIYIGEERERLPDMLVGYNTGYRCSGDSALGETGPQFLTTNPNKWSGDHSMDYRLVPGVLFSSRPILKADPALTDLPVTILKEFGIAKPEQMIGSSIYEKD